MALDADPPEPLLDALERLGPSGHLCISYKTRTEQLAAILPFIRRGLEQREQCVYIADDASRPAVLSALQSGGIEVAAVREAGALSVLGSRDTYRKDGNFDPERMLAWIRERTEAATRAGFSAFRVVGEMLCVTEGPQLRMEQLAEYEAKLNLLLPNRPVSALCAYDRRQFPADIIRQVIATHPLVVVGGTVSRNPYFVPPEEYLAPDWSEREVEWLLENLTHLQRAENELRESAERYRTLSQHLLEVQEMERRAIARELHDDLGQILTAIRLNLKRRAKPGVKRRVDTLAESIALIDEAIEHTRSLAIDLRPSILDDQGLAAALQWYVSRQAQRGGFEVRLEAGSLEEARLPPFLETACFRLVQEAFTNIVRHSGAQHVDVKVSTVGSAVEIVIRDDGRGFDAGAARKRAAAGASLGLLSMEERVSLAGGQLAIDSAPGRGTTIRAHVPLVRGDVPS